MNENRNDNGLEVKFGKFGEIVLANAFAKTLDIWKVASGYVVLALYGAENIIHVGEQFLLFSFCAEETRHLSLEVSDKKGMYTHISRSLDKIVDLNNERTIQNRGR